MINTILASAALLATATVVDAVGSAVVVNQCSFPVDMTNVPASGGGQNQIGPQTLSTGGTYSQMFTSLSNDQGWSIKLSVGNSQPLQYEYTYHNDGTIWYDLSAVNGDPFNGNWLISSGGGCDPKQAAYQYPTDDAAAMQSCPADSTITVTLCGGSGAAPAPPSGSGAPPAGSKAPAPPPAAPSSPSPPESAAPQVPSAGIPTPSVPVVPVQSAAPSVAAPASAAPSSGSDNQWGPPADKVGGFNQLQATPTTFDTKVAGGVATVTNVHTQVVTQYVTVSPVPMNKRSEHIHRHAERHNHF